MTLLTTISKPTIVHVIASMAGIAGLIQWRSTLARRRRLGMTLITARLAVSARQLPIRALIVIKGPQRPGAGVVAFIAGRAVLHLVHVILLVA